MINWQVIGQLIATGTIMLAGPAVIVLLDLKVVIFAPLTGSGAFSFLVVLLGSAWPSGLHQKKLKNKFGRCCGKEKRVLYLHPLNEETSCAKPRQKFINILN